MNIGFIGYSSRKFDEQKAEKLIYKAFAQISKIKEPIKIVSGATNIGIPKLVYEIANTFNYPTVGIMCKEGENYELFPVDELIVVGDNWGDESQTFIDYIDILYKIGGGAQSQTEADIAKENGIKVIEFDLEEIIDKRS